MNDFFDKETASISDELLDKLYQALKVSDDLRQKQYRGNPNIVAGHCYVASEALYHILGSDWQSYHIKHEGLPHWFLMHKISGEVLDVTKDQFSTPVSYQTGKRATFLTKEPSKRAKELMKRMGL